jgi:hypothetical protein
MKAKDLRIGDIIQFKNDIHLEITDIIRGPNRGIHIKGYLQGINGYGEAEYALDTEIPLHHRPQGAK